MQQMIQQIKQQIQELESVRNQEYSTKCDLYEGDQLRASTEANKVYIEGFNAAVKPAITQLIETKDLQLLNMIIRNLYVDWFIGYSISAGPYHKEPWGHWQIGTLTSMVEYADELRVLSYVTGRFTLTSIDKTL